ncbi:MAG TPA: fibronectin type III domain-containing protein [Acidimicrobiales bacterium]|nr:fibronectin type III domain-containing protein [Acidimicrobiales bacterium]
MASAPWGGHYNIISAYAYLDNYWSASGTAEDIDIYGLGCCGLSASTDWSNQPPTDSATTGTYNAISGAAVGNAVGWVGWNIAPLAARWLNQGEGDYGIELRSNPNGATSPSQSTIEYDNTGNSLRRFYSADYAHDTSQPSVTPYMDIVYQAPPLAPLSVTAQAGVDNATVLWDWNSAQDNGATTQSFAIVAYDATAGTTTTQTCTNCWNSPTTATTQLSYLFGGLTANHNYYFTVTGTNQQGQGQTSQQSNMVTVSSGVPGAPGQPGATAGSASATVNWGQPSSGAAPISSYTISDVDISNSSNTLPSQSCTSACTATTSPSFLFTGLTPGDSYEFSVSATNSYGTGNPSPWSNPVTPGSAVSLVKAYGSADPISGAVSCTSTTTASQTFARGGEVPYCLTVSNTSPTSVTVSSITDNLSASVTADGTPTLIGDGAPVTSSPASICQTAGACQVIGNTVKVASFALASGASTTFAFAAIAGGTGGACSSVTNTATASSSLGGATASLPGVVCDSGLGMEAWWSYISQPTGPQGSASVNVADGNLVVQQRDSTAVQAHGHLDYVLSRTYNSQDSELLTLPGSIGQGWTLNVSQADGAAGGGVGASGLYVPKVDNVLSATAVTLIDRDGTRHLFRPKGITAGPLDITTTPAGALATLAPEVLQLDTANYTHLCVDETYTEPAGVHLSLWRYVEANAACNSLSSASNVAVLGFAAERPDRVRYEFSYDGHLLDMIDGNGVDLRYQYTGAPVAGQSLGQLAYIYETAGVTSAGSRFACGPSTTTCRKFAFSYGTSSMTVTDPAGRQTVYTYGQAIPASGLLNGLQLTQVTNPDGTKLNYAYGACSSSGANQLCSASDPRGNTTSFTYTAGYQGPPRVATITDRRANASTGAGSVTTFTYSTSASYTTADTGPPATSCSGNAACHEQRFSSIDSLGRVGEVDEGDATQNYLHQTLNTWDTTSSPCRQPDKAVDNNLCRQVRRALNDTETGKSNGISTPDEDTAYTYNDEGSKTVAASRTGTGTLTSTWGYHSQYVESSGTFTTCGTSVGVDCFDDSVAGSGTVTSTGPASGRSDAGTLFYISDRTQSLSPNGNAAGSGYPNYLTTFEVDDNPGVPVNAVPSATVCANPGSPAFNTGDVCETDSPGATGVSDPPAGRCFPASTHPEPYECVSDTYDTFGEKITMTTAKANAETPATATPARYSYTYYADTTDCSSDPYDCDLSGNVTAGGWLKAVTDPTGSFVVFAYDRASNQVRKWDRNATQANPTLSAYPGTISAPTVFDYTQVLYGPAASAYSAPWRYELSSTDQMGDTTTYTVDADGNQSAVRSPRGNAAGTAAYDTTQAFDPDNNIISKTLPLGASGSSSGGTTQYTYDAFGNRSSQTDPVGNVTVYKHDSVNRLIETDWTRGPWPSDNSQPSACRESTSADAPIASGRILCSTGVAYDGVDNVTTTRDGNGQNTTNTYDGVHRKTTTVVPRNDGTLTTLKTAINYDSDGNKLDVCSAREFSEGSGTCSAGSLYATHDAYTNNDQVASTTTYRASGQADTTSFQYDADNNQTKATSPRGQTAGYATSYTFDLLDRKTSQTVPRDASHSYATSYVHDPAGDTTAVVAPGPINTGNGQDGALVIDGATYPSTSPFQVPTGAQYTSVTLTNGGWISIGRYNGSTGGYVDFSVTGALTVCSNCGITATGAGPAGGAGSASLTKAGTPGAGSGGGGGGGSSSTVGAGGGGGGHLATGAVGGKGGSSSYTGGGGAYGQSDLSDIGAQSSMGSGGGGGGNGAQVGTGGNGGAGGGAIRIIAGSLDDEGTIAADGTAGQGISPALTGGGGGGGGSGGDIWITTNTATLDGTLSAVGGPGGSGAASGAAGGGGSKGRVRLDANAVTGTNAGAFQQSAADGSYQRRYVGRVTAYSYDPDLRLVDTVEGADNTTASQAGTTDAKGGVNIRTRQLYDADGNVVATFAPGAFTSSVTSPNPDYMIRTDYDVDGRPTTSFAPRYDNSNTNATDLGASLDPANTQAAQCRTDLRPASTLYLPSGETVPAYAANEGVCEQVTQYDANGNKTKVVLATAAASTTSNRSVSYTYTDDNLVANITSPNAASDGQQVTALTVLYDGDGKTVRTTDANNVQTVNAYNADETLSQTTGQSYGTVTHVTRYSYDADGNSTKFIDPSGQVTTNTFYADNLKASTCQSLTLNTACGAGVDGLTTSFSYDPDGNTTQVTSPSGTAKDATNPSGTPTVNTYTDDNLLATTTVPQAADSTASIRRETVYSYDNAGRKTAVDTLLVDASGSAISGGDAGTQSFTYYGDDRLNTETGHNGTGTITYSYDPAGNPLTVSDSTSSLTVNATYYLDEQPRTVNDGAGTTTSAAYDGLGGPVASVEASSSTSYKTTYSYLDAELAKTLTSDGTGGRTTTFGYDAGRRLTTQQDYNTTGSTSPPDESITYAYNPDNTVQAATVTSPASTTLSSWGYTYDNNARVTAQTFTGQSATTGTLDTGTLNYSYDPAGRLASYADSSGDSPVTGTLTWDHDSNRLTFGAQRFTYNADDSLATGTDTTGAKTYTVAYTPSGDATSDACYSYAYDGFDRLHSATGATSANCANPTPGSSTYTYDGLDRQRSYTQTSGTTALHYTGLTTGLAVSTAPITGYDTVYAATPTGQPVGLTQEALTATTEYLTSDGQGNIATAVTPNGSVGCQVRYDPFGNPIAAQGATNPCSTGSTNDQIFYRSQRVDPTTGDYQLGSRTYDPTKSAFLTADNYRTGPPAANLSIGTDPLTRNTYTYVNGDPVNLQDNNGHDPCSATGGGGCYHEGAYGREASNSGVPGAQAQTPAAGSPADYRMADQASLTGPTLTTGEQAASAYIWSTTDINGRLTQHPLGYALEAAGATVAAAVAGSIAITAAPLAAIACLPEGEIGCVAAASAAITGLTAESAASQRIAAVSSDAGAALEETGGGAQAIETSIPDAATLEATPAAEDGVSLFSRSGAISNTEALKSAGGLARTMETVQAAARAGGIGLEGVDLQIVEDPEFATYLDTRPGGPAIARADQFGIQLGPASFSDEETLIRTLAHERTHIFQIGTFGSSSALTDPFEQAAYGIEQSFVDYWRTGGGG